jgi:3-oxoacyl-[acyl-carrier protein] reductase
VAPGFIETDMARAIPEVFRVSILKRIPAGRFGTVEEVAATVLFLLSDAAQYINGQTLVVDGGMSA